MTRFAAIGGIIAGLLLAPLQAAEAEVEVAEVTDLAAVSDEARARQVPLLLMFAAPHCGFCARLEDEYLKPMLRNRAYDDKVMVRKLTLTRFTTLKDFDGRTLDAAEFADRYAIDVTPTVVFFDARGRMLARRLVGLNNSDFYGAYLDDAIDTAQRKLKPAL